MISRRPVLVHFKKLSTLVVGLKLLSLPDELKFFQKKL